MHKYYAWHTENCCRDKICSSVENSFLLGIMWKRDPLLSNISDWIESAVWMKLVNLLCNCMTGM